jgi:chromosomal replication initiator protein
VISDSTKPCGQAAWTCWRKELPEQQFNTWIKPLTAQAAPDGSRLTLRWPTASSWTGSVPSAASSPRWSLPGQPVSGVGACSACSWRQPAFSAGQRCRPWRRPSLPAQRRARPAGAPARGEAAERAPQPAEPALTFDTLVEAGQPHGARRAARGGRARAPVQPAVHLRRRRPGQDPPDACGGQPAAGRQPDAKVLYIHAEQFVSDVVKAYQRKTFDEFKRATTRSTCC